MLSPIPESNSSKYDTIDSRGDPNYVRRFDPNDERKITASGSYKYDPNDERQIKSTGQYKLPDHDEEDDYENYSDDFESEEEDQSIGMNSDGCSGSTADTVIVN